MAIIDFTGTTGAPLDARLTVVNGAFDIDANRLRATALDASPLRARLEFEGQANDAIKLTFNGNGSTVAEASGLRFRIASATEFWACFIRPSDGRFSIGKYGDGNVYTEVDTLNLGSFDNTADYNIVVNLSGSSIIVDVNSFTNVLSATDSYLSTELTHGIYLRDTTVRVDTLDAVIQDAPVGSTVSITTPAYSAYQHVNDTFTVPLAFDYAGGAFTQVDYSTDGGSTYTTATPSTLEDGSGVVDIPLATGQYEITLRANTETDDAATDSVNYITVGDGFGVAIAQSNGEGVYDNAQVYTRGANDLRAVLYTVDSETFVEMRDHYSDDDSPSQQGSWVMRHAHHHLAITGRPCFYVPCPESGTSIEDWQKDSTRLFSGINLFNRSLARLTAVPVATIITQQGERNAFNTFLNPDGFPSIRESYVAKFTQVITDFIADLPYTPKFIVQPLHDMSTVEYQDANKDLIRLAQLDVVAARSDVDVSIPLTDFIFGLAGNDGTHFNTDAQADALGERLAIAWATYNLGVEGLAPVVSALPDRNVAINTATALSGTATDAGTIEVVWAVISGTGTISNNYILEPTVTLTDLAPTILQRAVHDGRNLILDTVTVTGVDADTTAPVITLNGQASVTITEGATYNDAGATATDNLDASVTVVVTNPVDTSVPATYTVRYNSTDEAGNVATEVTRTVIVEAQQGQTTTKNVTFDLPTEIVGQANMLYTLQLLSGGPSIANGTLDTSASTVTININSVGAVSNGTPIYLEARNLTTSNSSTAIGFAGTENAVVVTS